MKKIIGIFLCILLTTTSIHGLANNYIIKNSLFDNENLSSDPLNGGWIEEIDGVTILHVSGSHYDIGYQHGFLLKDKIVENIYLTFNDASQEDIDYIMEFWYTHEGPSTPIEYMEELQGIADGSGIKIEDIILFFCGWRYIMFGVECIEMAAWGPATKDGNLYSVYSCDLPEVAYDEEIGNYLHDNQILMVREPDDGFATLSVILPGEILGIGGMSEKGLSIGIESSPSYDVNYANISPLYRCRMLLESARSAPEAVDILTSERTGTVNCILSDGNIPVAYIIEEIASFTYVGDFNNPVEQMKPFWSIDHVVRRKNMFLHPMTAATQREYYNPKVYFFLGLLKKHINWYNPWCYYKTLSQEIEKEWGNLDEDSIMTIIKSIYRGKTNFYLNFSNNLGLEKFPAYYQWVACPKTGNFLISFAEGEKWAQYNAVHQFNLFDLLNSEPP